jgi:hypothetical protein
MGEVLEERKYALVIMPKFYAYADEMKTELESRGYRVDLFYEEPPRMIFLVMKRMSRWLRTSFFYYLFSKGLLRKIKKQKHRYSFFLVIRGNILTPSFIVNVKENFLLPGARNTYYTWDSFTYLIHKGKLAELFQNRFSFDSRDVRNNKGWELLPLYYTDSFDADKIDSDIKKEYDISCVAGFNEQRYLALKKLVETNPEIKFYVRLYLDKDLYEYKKKTSDFYRQLDLSWITFDLIPPLKVAEYNLMGKAILDYTDHLQCGLSMRTVESIGLNMKLITNNPYVKEYDFWKNGNVFFWDEIDDDNIINRDWLESAYHYDKEIKNRYSLHQWLDVLMG